MSNVIKYQDRDKTGTGSGPVRSNKRPTFDKQWYCLGVKRLGPEEDKGIPSFNCKVPGELS